MRRFDQHVARISNRQNPPRTQSGDKIGRHMGVGASGQAKRNSALIECLLQIPDGLADAAAFVVIETGQDMRRAGHHGNTLGGSRLRHRQ